MASIRALASRTKGLLLGRHDSKSSTSGDLEADEDELSQLSESFRVGFHPPEQTLDDRTRGNFFTGARAPWSALLAAGMRGMTAWHGARRAPGGPVAGGEPASGRGQVRRGLPVLHRERRRCAARLREGGGMRRGLPVPALRRGKRA